MKNTKGISAFLIFIGILFFLSLLLINPYVIQLAAGRIHSYYIGNIRNVQISIALMGFFFLLIGFLSYRNHILSHFLPNRRRQNIFLVIIIFLSALLFIEFVLRIKPTMTTAQIYDASVKYEGSIFSRNKLAGGDYAVPYPYLGVKKYEFHKGYHGPDFEFQKPEGEIRIVILGGSFIFGDHQDEWEEIEAGYNPNWILRIETKLKAKKVNNVRIINAGIPGHASFDSFGRLYSEIHLFQPDYVVMCHGWNDIKYFTKVNPENSLLKEYPPLIPKKRDDVVDPFEISQIYLRIKRLIQFSGKGLEGNIDSGSKKIGITKYAKRQFELNVSLFVQTCKIIDAQPILMTQPRLIHRTNTEAQRNRIAYNFQSLDHDGICDAYDFIDSVFLNFPDKDSQVFSHDFAKPYTGVDSLFKDHVHLNKNGSEVLSHHLADYFSELIQNR